MTKNLKKIWRTYGSHICAVVMTVAAIVAVLCSICCTPAQSAAQSSDAAQRQTATAGGDSIQETRSTTDQRQQQLSTAAPVAPQARDVGAMTVTARADFHDLGKNQLSLEERREERRSRFNAALAVSAICVLVAALANDLLGDRPHHKTVVILAGLGVAVAVWVPLIFS